MSASAPTLWNPSGFNMARERERVSFTPLIDLIPQVSGSRPRCTWLIMARRLFLIATINMASASRQSVCLFSGLSVSPRSSPVFLFSSCFTFFSVETAKQMVHLGKDILLIKNCSFISGVYYKSVVVVTLVLSVRTWVFLFVTLHFRGAVPVYSCFELNGRLYRFLLSCVLTLCMI